MGRSWGTQGAEPSAGRGRNAAAAAGTARASQARMFLLFSACTEEMASLDKSLLERPAGEGSAGSGDAGAVDSADPGDSGSGHPDSGSEPTTGGGTSGGTSGTSGGTPEDSDTEPVDTGPWGPCEFPQGVPDEAWIGWADSYEDTDPDVDDEVNAVMEELTGCGSASTCYLSHYPGASIDEQCQSWFAAVTAELRARGYCAGQHSVGSTDEIAVSNTGCGGKWYGYHVCYYGGPTVVWNPGARRGWWQIDASYCP